MESVSKLDGLDDLPRAQLIREHERMRTTLANIMDIASRNQYAHLSEFKTICKIIDNVNNQAIKR